MRIVDCSCRIEAFREFRHVFGFVEDVDRIIAHDTAITINIAIIAKDVFAFGNFF